MAYEQLPTPLTIAITGANSGIGLRAARQLALAGHEVVALCRDPDRGATALEQINRGVARPARMVPVDLADLGSVRTAAATVRREFDHLDALINNAALFDQTLRQPVRSRDGHELFWATNHLGPFLLTALLSPLLAAAPAPRLLTIASKGLIAHPHLRIRFPELDWPEVADWYTPTRAYYHAKLAQVMTSFSLAERAGGQLRVTCLRVPAVRLDPDRTAALPRLLRVLHAPKNRIALPPERLARSYAQLVTGHAPGAVRPSRDAGADPLRGLYVNEDLEPVRAPVHAHDTSDRRRLWTRTQAATGNPDWAW
ncbi:SDR family NAD(P)-dependent oxidoreductase [Saccharopolyspora sp. NPDC000359]|uniref:SDR family NAD(P)-dependent oxidoreductase n=1 Tax=Saccharopolyspora sp. NPDC000359 TaxID=3154251 RepID=UPI003330F30F